MKSVLLFLISLIIIITTNASFARRENKEKCPKVKAIRNFDLSEMMGYWYVVQYYASSEETPQYGCMRSIFSMSHEDQHVTMNFTYDFIDDPFKEKLEGNITWIIPNFEIPAHWIHTEHIYEGIYNTYIIDTDYKSWTLIMHCAEKYKQPRYLSALLLSRESTLGMNVVNFLREKLPRYDIDISFMFPIDQTDCNNNLTQTNDIALEYQLENNTNNFKSKQHPLFVHKT